LQTFTRQLSCTRLHALIPAIIVIGTSSDVFRNGPFYKSSAVAEMGDRGHNRDRPKRRGGGAVNLSREVGPRLVQCGLGRGLLPYQAEELLLLNNFFPIVDT